MIMELDKDDLEALVRGRGPKYSAMDNALVKKHGQFNGSYGTWNWNYSSLKECSEEELLEIYKICKDSWK